jgi:hypothetical protein
MNLPEFAPEMLSLMTVCRRYDWNRRTVRSWMKKGIFVTAYRHPATREYHFIASEVDQWAKAHPVKSIEPSLIKDFRLASA